MSAATLPPHARLHGRVAPGDFLDDYVADTPLSARAALERALALPGWVGALLVLRDRLVRPLGLKGAGHEGVSFPVEYEDEDEIILGFDDRHLDFRITVLKHGERVHIATWVHPHNLLGRAYLAVVLPFHKAILRRSIANIARA